MSTAVEKIMTKSTLAFIEADPEAIVLQRPGAATSDGAGGKTTVPGTTLECVVRLIPQSDKVPTTVTWEGTRSAVEYILMADPALRPEITKGSTFDWHGKTYRIAQIHDKPTYEFKADVILDVG